MESLYIRIRGEVLGPFDLGAARAAFRERKLTPSHEVSYDGGSWFPAARIWDELRSDAMPIKPALAPPTRTSPNIATAPPAPKPIVSTPPPARSQPPAATASPALKPIVSTPPPSRLKPPSDVVPPLRPAVRPPSDVRPPSLEMSAAALTPTQDELDIKPVPMGWGLATLSVLLPLAIIALMSVTVFFLIQAQEMVKLLEGLLNGDLTGEEYQARWQVIEVGLNQTEFGLIAGNLTAFILYCFWIYQADDLLHARRLRRLRFTPSACFGWEFVPIANYINPYRALGEVWDGSVARTKINWRPATFSPLILFYWVVDVVARISGIIITLIVRSVQLPADGAKNDEQMRIAIKEMVDKIPFSMAGLGFDLFACLLLLIVVVMISLRLRLKRPAAVEEKPATTITLIDDE